MKVNIRDILINAQIFTVIICILLYNIFAISLAMQTVCWMDFETNNCNNITTIIVVFNYRQWFMCSCALRITKLWWFCLRFWRNRRWAHQSSCVSSQKWSDWPIRAYIQVLSENFFIKNIYRRSRGMLDVFRMNVVCFDMEWWMYMNVTFILMSCKRFVFFEKLDSFVFN